jgi:hypothetical protein
MRHVLQGVISMMMMVLRARLLAQLAEQASIELNTHFIACMFELVLFDPQQQELNKYHMYDDRNNLCLK